MNPLTQNEPPNAKGGSFVSKLESFANPVSVDFKRMRDFLEPQRVYDFLK